MTSELKKKKIDLLKKKNLHRNKSKMYKERPPWLPFYSAAVWLTARVLATPTSHLIGHLCFGCLAVGGLVSQQVSVQVSLAGVAFRTVHAGVRTNTAV